jgi:signal transduction histidine kinase/CheY-like chemotaxis protein/HPt (histidine-containing phosphotransfer) domain-containing protein
MKKKLTGISERKKLLEISTRIASTLEADQVTKLLAQGLSSLIVHDTMAIYLAYPHNQELCPIILEGPLWKNPDLSKWCIPFNTGIIGSIVLSGNGERVKNAHLDSRSLYPAGALIKEEQLIVLPLKIGELCWGALVMNRMSDNYFSKDEFETAQFLASYTSLAINNIHLIEQVKERENNLRELIQAIPDNPIKVDATGKIVETPSENNSHQKTLHDVFPKEAAEQFLSSIQNVIKNQSQQTFEFHVTVTNDDVHYYEARVIPFSSNACIILARELTDIRKSEEKLKSTTSRFQNLILAIQAGVLVEDENRKIVLTNQKFCDMFEIPAPPEVMTGIDCSNAAENSKHLFNKPEEFVTQLKQLLHNKEMVVNEEIEMVSGKSYARDYVPIFVAEAYKGHMWLYRDITESKEAEKSLMKAKQLAEESGNAKQDFLAKMSHELRTPINGVLGLTNLMFTSTLTPENLEYLKGIRSSGEHLLSIINDILDLAKIEVGKLKLDSVDFKPRHVINRLLKGLQPQAAEKGLYLEFVVEDNIPEYIKGDPVRMNQILLNLLSNAMKFTLSGGVTLQFSLDHEEAKMYYLKFKVADTGIGIAEDKLQMVFERFTQADDKTAVKFGGTGLGLTIVKQLVEMQHGEVRLTSKPGVGTTFEIIIPYEEGQASDSIHEDEETWSNYKSFVGSRVLLVEDNLINQIVARKTLEKWQIDVTVADNGLIALEYLRSNAKFDLIIMDVQMPEMDGFEATHKIRTEMEEPVRSTPIIAMTASVLFDPEKRVKDAGMNEYISKPFQLSELNSMLAKFLKPSDGQNNINMAAPGKTHLDSSFLESIAPDNHEFQNQMIELFEKESVFYMTKIKEAFRLNNFSEVQKSAHTFKPLGAYIGVTALTDLVGKLEIAAMNETSTPQQLAVLIEKIETLLNEVKPEVENFKTNNSTIYVN